MQITKKERRQRRAVRTRAKIRELGQPRLTIHRTPRHIYAQVFDSSGAKVLVAASTVQDAVANGLTGTGNVEAQGCRPCDRRACESRWHLARRVRSSGFHVPRSRQGAGRGRA